jgi:hypothetical protein
MLGGVITSYSATPAYGGSGYTTTTGASHTGAVGGGFSVTTTRTINANIISGTATCVTYSGASGTTLTVSGSIYVADNVSVNAVRGMALIFRAMEHRM